MADDNYEHNGTANFFLVPMQFTDFTLDVNVTPDVGTDSVSLALTISDTLNEFFSLNSVIGPIPSFVVDIGKPIYISNVISVIEAIDGVSSVEITCQGTTPGSLVPETGELPRVAFTLSVV